LDLSCFNHDERTQKKEAKHQCLTPEPTKIVLTHNGPPPTGAHTIKRDKIRADVTSMVVKEDGRKACPRYNQVRLVAYHHIQAKVRTNQANKQ
jgi:hypothetical protein